MRIDKFKFYFLLVFSFFYIWSSFELIITNQIDLDGDAIYYFETALNKNYSENFYPIYPLFISYFGLDNPYFTRLIQFLFLYLVTGYIFKLINQKKDSTDSNYLFKYFYITNFGIYLLAVQLVRDWMIFSLTSLTIIVFAYESKQKKKFVLTFLFLAILFPLSQVLPIVIILSIFLVYIQFNVINKASIFRLIVISFIVFLLFLISSEYIESLIYRTERILDDKVLLDESAKNNLFIGFFNFLFGPGLIRPLFPSKYYLVYTYYFTSLTWFACLSWFIQFSFSTSVFINNNKRLNFSKNFFFFFYSFIIYLFIYVSTFGGPGGLRKRMIGYFLFSLCVKELLSKVKIFPVSKNVLYFTLIFLLIIIISTSIIGV